MSDILERLAACIAGTVTPEDRDAITLEACAEIARLRLTDEEREAVEDAASRYVEGITPKAQEYTDTLRSLLERTNLDAVPAATAEPSRKSDAQHPSAAELRQPAEEGLGTGNTQMPVAWRVYDEDGSEAAYLCYEQARAAADDWNWSVEPLYRQPKPTLTDEEREAIRQYWVKRGYDV